MWIVNNQDPCFDMNLHVNVSEELYSLILQPIYPPPLPLI